jgi:hypothetical protein
MKFHSRVFLTAVSAVWLVITASGLLLLVDYDSKPGALASPPRSWPSEVSLVRNSAKPTLLMFLHPRCPCSWASLNELARIAFDERETLDVLVLFTQPPGVDADWSHTDLWEKAVANDDLRVAIDADGLLTKQFGAKTSGQVLVYDTSGRLRFDGGITPGRGHVGDSVGRSLVTVIAASQYSGTPASCSTYGCPLYRDRFAMAAESVDQ